MICCQHTKRKSRNSLRFAVQVRISQIQLMATQSYWIHAVGKFAHIGLHMWLADATCGGPTIASTLIYGNMWHFMLGTWGSFDSVCIFMCIWSLSKNVHLIKVLEFEILNVCTCAPHYFYLTLNFGSWELYLNILYFMLILTNMSLFW